jgi:cytochrome P450
VGATAGSRSEVYLRAGKVSALAWGEFRPICVRKHRRIASSTAFRTPDSGRLRTEAPVYFQRESEGPGFWCITRYEDVRHASRDPRRFLSWLGGTNLEDPPGDGLEKVRAIMLNMDPPRHVKLRRMVQRAFTPRTTHSASVSSSSRRSLRIHRNPRAADSQGR